MDALLITKCGCTRKIGISYPMPTLAIPFHIKESMMEAEHCKIPQRNRRDFKLELDISTKNLLLYKEI